MLGKSQDSSTKSLKCDVSWHRMCVYTGIQILAGDNVWICVQYENVKFGNWDNIILKI